MIEDSQTSRTVVQVDDGRHQQRRPTHDAFQDRTIASVQFSKRISAQVSLSLWLSLTISVHNGHAFMRWEIELPLKQVFREGIVVSESQADSRGAI